MKKIKWLALAPIATLSILPIITSCNSLKTHDVKDYVINVKWNNYSETDSTFNILQLTDIHIANTTDKPEQYKFLQEVINKAKESSPTNRIDLIVITGDLFDFASKAEANEFINFFEKQKINWTCVFGNHDEQNYFSIDWLTSRLNEITQTGGYCKFKNIQNDDVYGNCNFVINLQNNEDDVEQLVMIDSNTYRFYPKIGYDYIHQDQIDWYDRVVKEFNMTKSLAFFHIPFHEFEVNYQKAKNGQDGVTFITDKTGIKRDKYDNDSAEPKVNTNFYSHLIGTNSPAGYQYNHTQGVFIGHNHFNDYCVNVPLDGGDNIQLCFGIKSSNKVECDDHLGGQLISLKKDGSFDLYSILNQY